MSSLSTFIGVARSLVVYYGQPWRRRSLGRFYRALIPDGALVFDIGAHVGSRTRSLLSNGSHCVALEPQPVFAKLLHILFRNDKRVSLVTKAVGKQKGQADLHVSSRHPTVTTLSNDWLSRVAPTNGFEAVDWDQRVSVEVTTLDALIAEYGLPEFCKIDVEGMEAEILAGLSVPVPIVAIEYIPATIDIALACVYRLEALGSYEYNLSKGEEHSFQFSEWLGPAAIAEKLQRIAATEHKSGDLYARLKAQEQS